jgi:hypothetical protein
MKALMALGSCVCLAACQYQVTPDIPDASGPFVGDVAFVWAPSSTAVTASFTEPQFAQAGCAGTQMGNCCVYGQPQIDIAAGGVEPITLSAGTLAVDDGDTFLASFGFQGVGYYPLSSAETPALAWNPGDVLSVDADGGIVDPFSGEVIAPPAFAGVSPALTLTGQIVIPLTQDFTASWTPAADGGESDGGYQVMLSLFDPSGFYVDCTVPDGAGTVTAPAATLTSFIPGDNGYVTLTRSSSLQRSAANATITLTAEATAPGLAHFQ